MSLARSLTILGVLVAGLTLLAVQATAGASKHAASQVTCPSGSVRFGIEPYEDPAKLTPAYKVLAGALQKALGCPVKLQIVEDYPAEVLAMRNKKLEIAEFGPLGFVFASQRAHAQPLVSFADSKGHLTTYKAGIWVPNDSTIQSITDLPGQIGRASCREREQRA